MGSALVLMALVEMTVLGVVSRWCRWATGPWVKQRLDWVAVFVLWFELWTLKIRLRFFVLFGVDMFSSCFCLMVNRAVCSRVAWWCSHSPVLCSARLVLYGWKEKSFYNNVLHSFVRENAKGFEFLVFIFRPSGRNDSLFFRAFSCALCERVSLWVGKEFDRMKEWRGEK